MIRSAWDSEEASPRLASAAASRRVEPVEEYGSTQVPLDLLMRDGKFDFTANPDLFQLRFKGNEVVITASHFVGQIAVNDRLVLDVRPRVSIERLDRMLRLSGHVPIEAADLTRGYALSSEPLPALLDIVARAFLVALQPLRVQGLYRRYEPRREDTAFPRGRFLLGPTVQRHRARGRAQATVSYFEHSADNGPNRALKLALWQLAALVNDRGPTKGWMQLVSELNRASHLFDGVRLDLARSFQSDREVDDPHRIPSSRSYYLPAIQLAKYVIEGRSIDFDRIGEELTLPSLLIDLQDVFERYLRTAIRLQVERLAYGISILDGNLQAPNGGAKELFDTRPSVDANPDIVVRQAGSVLATVLGEVKYIDRNFSREDINQAIAYAVSYHAPCLLIKPRRKGEAVGLHPHGEVAGTRIYRYHFDLAADLEDQERRLARVVLAFTSGSVDVLLPVVT